MPVGMDVKVVDAASENVVLQSIHEQQRHPWIEIM